MSSFLACKKEEPLPNARWPHWGEVTGLLNGEPWVEFMTNKALNRPWHIKIYAGEGADRSKHPCNLNTFSIVAAKFNPAGFRRERIGFHKIPNQEGIYPLTGRGSNCEPDSSPSASFATSEDDGDVGKDYYEVLRTEESYLAVASFDPATKEIRGTFRVTFLIKNRSRTLPTYPDTVRFTNGEFRTKIFVDRG